MCQVFTGKCTVECVVCGVKRGLIVYICSQDGWTAVLLAAAGGHLDLVRELVEQHRVDLLHKLKVSSASFCV